MVLHLQTRYSSPDLAPVMEPTLRHGTDKGQGWSFKGFLTSPVLWWWFALLVSLTALLGMHA